MSRAQLTSTVEQNSAGAAAPFLAGKNKIINGDFGIWQRGTSFAGYSTYTADRWLSDNPTTTRQPAGLNGFNYCLQVSNTTGNPGIRQGIELPVAGNAGQFYVGSTWTISFWAKTSTTVSFPLYAYAAFSDFVGGSGGNFQQVVNNSLGIPTTTWTRYSTTFTVSVSPVSTNTCLMVVPYLTTGAYSGNLSITGIQLEAGSVATPFTTASGTLQGELSLCQRYFCKSYDLSVAPGTATYVNSWAMDYGTASTSKLSLHCTFPVVMRTAPTVLTYDEAGTSGVVSRNGNGKTGAANAIGSSGCTLYSSDTTSSSWLSVQWTATAEL
jgi:hypothetical protein